ncbi:fucose mutarotase-like [Centruroides vittatus]|uniref:fucose mutarotase-like n=1 Tax=Centruroides vittatus TaxID=120091 RepID=UPI00350EEBB5
MGLIGISTILSPDLLHALCSMGHGDEIVLADVHFPTSSLCRNGPKEIRLDGQEIPELLRAILKLMPLDTYVKEPICLMKLESQDENVFLKTDLIWRNYYEIIEQLCPEVIRGDLTDLIMQEGVEYINRIDFYNKASKAFAIVHTGETAQYSNIILTKGVVKYCTTEFKETFCSPFQF